MRARLPIMLSTSSLQAFSNASVTASLRSAAPSAPAARLVRDDAPARSAPLSQPLPVTKPNVPPARGSLLNLSV